MKISDFINRNLFPVILLSHFLQGKKKVFSSSVSKQLCKYPNLTLISGKTSGFVLLSLWLDNVGAKFDEMKNT